MGLERCLEASSRSLEMSLEDQAGLSGEKKDSLAGKTSGLSDFGDPVLPPLFPLPFSNREHTHVVL